MKFSKSVSMMSEGTVPGGHAATPGPRGTKDGAHAPRNALFKMYDPVVWLLAVGSPVITGCRCGAATKKNVRL